MSMIACLSCKTVVWAYDHGPHAWSGLMNGMKMPCPKCGKPGSFDGWWSSEWLEMRAIADAEGLTWEPDGHGRWFGEKTGLIAEAVVSPHEPDGCRDASCPCYQRGYEAERRPVGA